VVLEVDPSEYVFKLALSQKRFDTVLALVRSGALCGQAVVSYLRAKGFPEVALHFAGDDARARFDLALECGSIEVALDAARQLDEPATWRALGGEALRHGNVAVAEFAYQRVRDYGRLAFLYALVGATDKLAKTVKLAAARGDARSRWQFATYAGDAAERVRALEAAGLPALAAAAAASAGLEEDAARLAEEAGEAGARAAAAGAAGARLAAPEVLQRGENWPLLSVSKGLFESLAAKAAANAVGAGGAGAAAAAVSAAAAATASAAASAPGKKGAFDLDDDAEVDAGAWGDDDGELDLDGSGGGGGGDGAFADAGGDDENENGDDDAGWEMEDLELPDVGRGGAAGGASASASSSKAFVAPSPGVPVDARWLKAASGSKLAAEHVAAGAPDAAMRLLNSQLGFVEFAPLRPYFLEIRAAAVAAAPGLPGCPAVRVPLPAAHSADDDAAPPRNPALPYSLPLLEAKLRAMYKHVTEGKFSEGLRSADALLHLVPLTVRRRRRRSFGVSEFFFWF
jgi:coatomer protein complex subunit alpha (xenin)